MRNGVILCLALGLFATAGLGCNAKSDKKAAEKADPADKWVVQSKALTKAACACTDADCARKQQKALTSFAQKTKGEKIDKQRAGVVARYVLEASTCVSKTLLKDKLKKLKKLRDPMQ